MDNDSRTSGNAALATGSRNAKLSPRTPLHLVSSRTSLPLALITCGESWRAGALDLLDWLGVEATLAAADPAAPHLYSPASVFDYAPSARWVVGYLLEQGSGLMLPRGGIDVMLISPHSQESGDGPVWEEMLRAAQAEGRERIAVIWRGCQGPPPAVVARAATIISLDEAMRRLSADALPWDAVIAPPDLRATLFGELARIADVRGPWPLLLHDESTVRLRAEGAGDGDFPLDAHCLVQSLALALRQAGRIAAARRLHDAWARLRDTGITTHTRGRGGPYASVLSDADCIAMISKGLALSRRDVPAWKALSSTIRPVGGSQMHTLRVVR